MEAAEIRVRGRVQGVGFRPAVWRLARELGLSGDVRNDADGVLIRVAGEDGAIGRLLDRLHRTPPPLARIDRIERVPSAPLPAAGFHIVGSAGGIARTEVAPDAAICAACAQEVLDPAQRRHGYAFANCTECGPRFSIVHAVPYDRAATTMASFALCPVCRGEYQDPADRRFHAEAIACPACGPRVRHIRTVVMPGEGPASTSSLRDVVSLRAHRCKGVDVEPSPGMTMRSQTEGFAAAVNVLRRGGVLALKGIGGYQLACDATNVDAVARLRAAKRRDSKPFALMARDPSVVRQYCHVDADEARLLRSAEAPIVLLRASGTALPDAIAPGLATLGFMLPTTPLHLLLLRDFDQPLVMTSGNLTDAPQIIEDAEALRQLGGIADAVLTHDRPIATRVDDSVARVVAGVPRLLRRARGYAPSAITLPEGFAAAPDVLGAGGELKATFCLLQRGRAILSQHIGDLEDAGTLDDYRCGIAHFAALFDHAPAAVAIDPHPEYLSSKHAGQMGLPLIEVQHHHAHVAACLAENARALDAPPVLGVVLDGLGWGADGTIWGGEFLLADYRGYRRLGALRPVAMPGGTAAVREPWRNLYAHLRAAEVDPRDLLADKPCEFLDAMIGRGINAPLASSCGRLFDAVAAALNICRDRQRYEGEAAARLEALACQQTLNDAPAYPFAITDAALPFLDPTPMWRALVADLHRQVSPAVMAARFHQGLAIALVAIVRRLGMRAPFDTVALSGGCLQNALLLEQTMQRLARAGFTVLTHSQVPANDGGLALGQAAVAAARLIA